MPIIAKNDAGAFVPAPEGQHAAVCCDVIDLGIVRSEWQGKVKAKHKIRVAFQLEEKMADGRPFIVQQQFTLTMDDRGRLRPFLESWRGKPYTEEQAKGGIDVELLIGANAVVQVVHADRAGKTYANIQSIMKPMKGMPVLKVSSDYVRVQDRTTDALSADDHGNESAPPHDDDDLPF